MQSSAWRGKSNPANQLSVGGLFLYKENPCFLREAWLIQVSSFSHVETKGHLLATFHRNILAMSVMVGEEFMN